MIRHNGTTSKQLRRPWRRRISNQFAIIAAIMLFASTQIGNPEAAVNGISAQTDVVAQSVSHAAAGSGPANEPATAENSNTVSTVSKKRKRLKLDLFLFRR